MLLPVVAVVGTTIEPFFYGLYGGLVGLSAIVTVAGGSDLARPVDQQPRAELDQRRPRLGSDHVLSRSAGRCFLADVTLTQCLYAFIVCTAGGLAAGGPARPPRLHSLRNRDHGDQAGPGHRPLGRPGASASRRCRVGHSPLRAWYSLQCRGEQKKITRSLS